MAQRENPPRGVIAGVMLVHKVKVYPATHQLLILDEHVDGMFHKYSRRRIDVVIDLVCARPVLAAFQGTVDTEGNQRRLQHLINMVNVHSMVGRTVITMIYVGGQSILV